MEELSIYRAWAESEERIVAAQTGQAFVSSKSTVLECVNAIAYAKNCLANWLENGGGQ